MSNILIFTGPVRSGKTTMLWNKFAARENVGGFLTPDKENGVRQFYDLAGKTFLPFELPAENDLPAVEIGRFRFSAATFERGREILLKPTTYDLFIVDEVGRLEVENGAGWEPALTVLIEDYKLGQRPGKLLLVVRDSLVMQTLEKWKLTESKITILKAAETLDSLSVI